MPNGDRARKQWQKIPLRFRVALKGKTADPADELQWVMNNICITYKQIDTDSPPSLGAMRLLAEAKDDKGFKDFLSLWQRTIPPVIAKREGFSDDNRHVFPLLERLEREFEKSLNSGNDADEVEEEPPESTRAAGAAPSHPGGFKEPDETQAEASPEGPAPESEVPSAFA